MAKMKIISRRTIRAICKIPPEKLAEKKIITPARNGGIICPLCSNGAGQDGTGISPQFVKEKGYWHWWCPRCGKNFNNLSAFAAHYKIDNFNELCKKICADFGITAEYEEKDSPRFSRRRRTKKSTSDNNVSESVLKVIRGDLQASIEPLKRFLQFGCDKNLWRGLPLEFLLKFGCRFNHAWIHPKKAAARKFDDPSPRLIIPCSSEAYLARLTCDIENFDESARPRIHEKEHVGIKQLFNRTDLQAGKIVFAVEGYVDAMSVVYAGFKCVALGGANELAKLVDAVADMPEKPLIIALLDSDETGRKSSNILVDDLITVGCPAVARFLSEEDSKIDCNQILDERGVDELRDILAEIYDNAESELAAVAQIIEERKTARIAAKVDSLFSGDASDLDFARRIEAFCGDSIRWVTDDKSWLLYQRNEHGGGLWRDGGEQNSCLLPFVREMSDMMTEYAENQEEHELADKMKSTRKVLQSITMVKSLDSILITSADLDKHSELICCLNGVCDLQSGTLMTADPKTLLMTRSVNAVFGEPSKENLQFVKNFFAQIMPDEMTRAGLLRWLGYCLSGETSAEKFMVWVGESGANGKGTLGGTMLALMDSYGVGLPPRALLKSNRPIDADRATTALNGLDGRRFALSEEIPLDGEMDSSLVKNLSGGDRINLRLNFKEFRTLINHAKINISGNFTPRLENVQDGGIRRRLLNMPFTEQFTGDRADPSLKKKLLLPDNLNALFAILVREAVNWYRDGLIISEQMTQATQKHLDDSDFVADFLSEYYEFGEGLSVKVKEVIDLLKEKCPAECRPFRKRKDLINLVAHADGVTLDLDSTNTKIFKGIGKPKPQPQQDGEILSSDDYPPFD